MRVVSEHQFGVDEQILLISRKQWLFDALGAVSVNVEVEVADALPPPARIGLHCQLATVQPQVEWLGLGPHENYRIAAWPRSTGAGACRWRICTRRIFSPARTACAATPAACATAAGASTAASTFAQPLRAATADGLQPPASAAAGSGHLAAPGRFPYGVGGDDSWSPSVHRDYLLTAGIYRYQLRLQRAPES